MNGSLFIMHIFRKVTLGYPRIHIYVTAEDYTKIKTLLETWGYKLANVIKNDHSKYISTEYIKR